MQKRSPELQKNSLHYRYQRQKAKLEWSKTLTKIDIISWVGISLILLLLMFFKPELASYCVNMFSIGTAAYVSMRLGYTAKAGVENYRKIKNTIKELEYNDSSNVENG